MRQYIKRFLRSLVNSLPLKQPLFRAIRFFWVPSPNVYQHLHFVGKFSVELTQGQRFFLYHPGFIIENEIFWRGLYGSWEADSLRLWSALATTSKEILDIGANTGVYSVLAKAHNPDAIVHAFEPNKKYFEFILKNNLINSFDIKAHDYGIGDSDSDAMLGDYSGERDYIEARVRSIDSLIEDKTIRRVDLIKIDVERYEVEVLRGFSKYISLYTPAIIIEVLDDNIANMIDDFISGLRLDYLKFNINERGSIRQTDIITKSDHWNYLLCTQEQALGIGLLAPDDRKLPNIK